MIKQQVFPHCTSTHITDSWHQSMHHCLIFLNTQVFTIFCVHYGPFRFKAIEKMTVAGLAAVSNSGQSRRIAGTFDLCVSQNVDRQPLDARENGQGMGPQAEGLRCRQRLYISSSNRHGRPLSYRSQTQRRTRHQHTFESPWHPPQTQTAPQARTTQWALRILKSALIPIFASRKLANGPRAHFAFVLNVPHMVQNGTNMRRPIFEEIDAFLRSAFSPGERQIRENACIQQHACSVDPLGVSVFSNFRPCSTNQKKEVETRKMGSFRGAHFFEIGPPKLPKGAHFELRKNAQSYRATL